jgi:carbamoyltransferase
MMLTAGLGGASRHGCVALSNGERLLGVCEQERVTRVRGAGFNATGLPDEALDTLLQRRRQTRKDVARYVQAETMPGRRGNAVGEVFDHHLGHACTAYLTSPFDSSVVVVCDHEAPTVSVWVGSGSVVSPVEWPWRGPGFSDLYSRCAEVLGFSTGAGDQRMEALARLRPFTHEQRLEGFLRCDETGLVLKPGWEATVESQRSQKGRSIEADAELAAELQWWIGSSVLELLTAVHRRLGGDRLCLAGSLFYHSAIITMIKRNGPFKDVFVPIDPGNPGLAVGTALHANGKKPNQVSPFLGPEYTSDEIKETLDNCKLSYQWESDQNAIGKAVEALLRGYQVSWFDGPMEWGPRALGARCILASPFSPFVLENLNRFLKRREAWRGYALSGLEHAIHQEFEGPRSAPFMECDYTPRDAEKFKYVLPLPGAAVRAQTVGMESRPRFRMLLEAFGAATGTPILVNTSFNGFHEPIVCNPRDAVRVFYGTGLDLLVLGPFMVSK